MAVLWALLFTLPVVKMILLGVFLVVFARSQPDPGEPLEVRRRLGPQPRPPRPRTGRGGPRGIAATRRSRALGSRESGSGS